MKRRVKAHYRKTKTGKRKVKAHFRDIPKRLTPDERKIYTKAQQQVLELSLRDKDAIPILAFPVPSSDDRRHNMLLKELVSKPGRDREKAIKKELLIDPTFGSAPTRYTRPDGKFKMMTNPDKPSSKKSKFYGCVRAMRSEQYGKKYSKDASKKICASIARKKK